MDFSLTKKKKKKKKDLDEDLEGGKAQRAEEAENGTYLCILEQQNSLSYI
jgi:hypothetical protein